MFVFLVVFVHIRYSYTESLLLPPAMLPREPCMPLETAIWLLTSQIKIVDIFLRLSHGGMNQDYRKIFFLSFLAPEHVWQQTRVHLKCSPPNGDAFHGLFNSEHIHWHQTIFFIRSVIVHYRWHLILCTGRWSLAYPLSSPTHSLPGNLRPDSNLPERRLNSALTANRKNHLLSQKQRG